MGVFIEIRDVRFYSVCLSDRNIAYLVTRNALNCILYPSRYLGQLYHELGISIRHARRRYYERYNGGMCCKSISHDLYI